MAQKILILSLGTGAIETSTEKKKNCPYITAKYVFEDGKDETVSPFVAEALIKRLKPEKIVIIGTGKSAWGAFYLQYCDKSLSDYEARRQEIEAYISKMGGNSSDEEIYSFEQYLDELYHRELDIPGKPQIKLCLTRYGMNEAELKSIYIKLRDSLREVITESASNAEDTVEISFDITHSFRSIPLYNLAVIDYCRLLSPSKITISHVYYGNLEVARETGEARIVDLKDIVNLMETTRGISEFKNTGNTTSFLQWQEECGLENDDFLIKLRDFNDYAQLNNRKRLLKSIEDLLSSPFQGDENVLMDAKATIREILHREFFISDNHGDDTVSRQRYKAKFQLALARWCLKNRQVGLASAIAKEAFRSFLVTVYETPEDEYENENRRKNAEYCFSNKVQQACDNSLFAEYMLVEKRAVKVRNVFAHNLEYADEENYSYSQAYDDIKNYIVTIEEIMQLDQTEFVIENVSLNASEQNVIVFISGNDKEIKRYFKHATGAYLFGDFSETDTKKIRTLAKIITMKLEIELTGRRISKVVFGNNIDDKLIQHTGTLLRACRVENIAFTKWNGTQENTILLCTWPFDVEKIMQGSYALQNRLAGYKFQEM